MECTFVCFSASHVLQKQPFPVPMRCAVQFWPHKGSAVPDRPRYKVHAQRFTELKSNRIIKRHWKRKTSWNAGLVWEVVQDKDGQTYAQAHFVFYHALVSQTTIPAQSAGSPPSNRKGPWAYVSMCRNGSFAFCPKYHHNLKPRWSEPADDCKHLRSAWWVNKDREALWELYFPLYVLYVFMCRILPWEIYRFGKIRLWIHSWDFSCVLFQSADIASQFRFLLQNPSTVSQFVSRF